jgi:hypothetical protein
VLGVQLLLCDAGGVEISVCACQLLAQVLDARLRIGTVPLACHLQCGDLILQTVPRVERLAKIRLEGVQASTRGFGIRDSSLERLDPGSLRSELLGQLLDLFEGVVSFGVLRRLELFEALLERVARDDDMLKLGVPGEELGVCAGLGVRRAGLHFIEAAAGLLELVAHLGKPGDGVPLLRLCVVDRQLPDV